jgi:uncharacterized Tic20 family protein
MNDNIISKKIRYIAAALHLIFAISKLSVILIFTQETHWIQLSFILIVIRPIVAWILWLITSRIDRFINLAGRDIVNYSLNNLTLFLWIGFPLLMIWIILALTKIPLLISSGTSNIVIGGSVGILFCVEIAYLVHAIVASTFAFRGHRFKSDRIHDFVRAE